MIEPRHVVGALPGLVVGALAAEAEAVFARIDARIARVGPFAAGDVLPPGVPWVPTASSVGLGALREVDSIVDDVIAALEPALTEALGGPPLALRGSAWLRRQRPPRDAPPWHAAHSWHQDGALGFDFARDDPRAPGALAPMITCWLPLGACGEDAPGLGWVRARPTRLLTPAELAVPRQAEVALVLDPGDALLFGGDLLHATWRTDAMTRTRVSVELRFVRADAVPPRLRRFVGVDWQ